MIPIIPSHCVLPLLLPKLGTFNQVEKSKSKSKPKSRSKSKSSSYSDRGVIRDVTGGNLKTAR
ncbi:hypothetical protein JCM24511_08819 [Saitozyma sp. JCM 24511]|nr:hypothetical protein JCM24511_08819 [Saitozyma sp. JCM 24511]